MTVPFDPRVGRQRYLTGFLRIATVVVLASAVLGVVLRDDAGQAAATVMVALLIAIPLVRLVWLVLRWLHKGDRRFAALAVLLILLVGVGAVLGAR
jgi:hypothetical protein